MGFDSRKNVTQGDAMSHFFVIGNLPTGTTIVKAWLTLKVSISDADGAAVLQKIIDDTDDTPGTGQIVNDGTGTTKGEIRFDVTPDDSTALTPGIDYYYDVKIKTSAATMNIFTVDEGRYSVDQHVTLSNT